MKNLFGLRVKTYSYLIDEVVKIRKKKMVKKVGHKNKT